MLDCKDKPALQVNTSSSEENKTLNSVLYMYLEIIYSVVGNNFEYLIIHRDQTND